MLDASLSARNGKRSEILLPSHHSRMVLLIGRRPDDERKAKLTRFYTLATLPYHPRPRPRSGCRW